MGSCLGGSQEEIVDREIYDVEQVEGHGMIFALTNVCVGLVGGAVGLLTELLGKLQSQTRVGRFGGSRREDTSKLLSVQEEDSNFHAGKVCDQEQEPVGSMLV